MQGLTAAKAARGARSIGATRLLIAACLAWLAAAGAAFADSAVNAAIQADKAFTKYGLTGKGTIVAILDRGIDYTHPDFRNADGTTRIRMMWDMSNVSPNYGICDPRQPAPIVYTEAQINQALQSGAPLGERDALGHGTVTAGLAAGNGSAALPSSQQWAGLAPQADLLIVRLTSEYVPAHGTPLQPEQLPFQGCTSLALDLVTQEAAALGEPIAALVNSGVQWGPIDGTSVVSAKIDADFAGPGQIYVSPSGDEGTLPNHAQAKFGAAAAVFNINKTTTDAVAFQLWYTGAVPANVTLSWSDTGTSVSVPPGNVCNVSADASVELCSYLPGQQFYPWTSSGPDRAVYLYVYGHSGAGTLTVARAGTSGTGTADVYGDATSPTPVISFTGQLTPGRLTDYSSSSGAIVDGCFNVRTRWTDINGNPESLTNEGKVGDLWLYSSGGPTRDGRSPLTSPAGGVDVTTPGGNAFGAYSPTSYWGDRSLFYFNLIKGGNGYYGRQSATSGSAPILLGAASLLLQMNPHLTTAQLRQIIDQTAVADKFTGPVPGLNWGWGKLDVLAAADAVASGLNTAPGLSTTSLVFGTQTVGTASKPQTVRVRNAAGATDALGITNVAVSGDFRIKSNTCPASLAPGASCTIGVTFRPTQVGMASGALTIKELSSAGPAIVALSGTGN